MTVRNKVALIFGLAGLIGMVCIGMPGSSRHHQVVRQGTLERFQRGAKSWQEDIKVVDNREVVVNTTHTPWSQVCKIIATFSDGHRSEGSGTMIGPHHCLTARHVIYDGDTVPIGIQVIPGYDGSKPLAAQKPFGSAGWTQLVNWKDWDIALIVTDTNIGNKSGWLGTYYSNTDDLVGKTVHLAGYPGDKDDAQRMYYDAGKIIKEENDTVEYELGSYKGQSGAGVFECELPDRLSKPTLFYVVGVHTHGGVDFKSGTVLRRSLFDKLRDYKDDKFPVEWNVKIPKD